MRAGDRGDDGVHGGFWDFLANFDINRAGFAIAGLFVVRALAIGYWRLAHVETRWPARDRRKQPEPPLSAPPAS